MSVSSCSERDCGKPLTAYHGTSHEEDGAIWVRGRTGKIRFHNITIHRCPEGHVATEFTLFGPLCDLIKKLPDECDFYWLSDERRWGVRPK